MKVKEISLPGGVLTWNQREKDYNAQRNSEGKRKEVRHFPQNSSKLEAESCDRGFWAPRGRESVERPAKGWNIERQKEAFIG